MDRGHPGIGKQLLEARRRLGISQRELSRRSDLTQAQISRIENGVVDMRVSSLLALAEVLQLELSLNPSAPSGSSARGGKPPKARPRITPRDRPESGSAAVSRRAGIFGDIDEELL